MSEAFNPQPAPPDPDPTMSTAAIKPASPARERTFRHMRRLLARAALAGAALEATGCIVCDPLPPPVTCDDGVTKDELAGATWSEALWVQGTNGLHVQLQVEIWAELGDLTFSDAPSCEGATLDSFGRQDFELTVLCTPTQGATTVTVSVPMKCDASTDVTLRLILDVSATPAVGNPIPVTIAD